MQHVTDCHVDPAVSGASPEEKERAAVQYLAVAGMGCPNCANRVRNSLLLHAGVLEVEVELPTGLTRVWYDDRRARIPELLAAVNQAGEGTHHRYLAVPLRSGS